MAGSNFRVLDENTFSVTAAQLPAGQIFTIPVALNIPSAWALYGSLILRCHAFNVGTGGTGTAPSVYVTAHQSAPTDEDPNTLYRNGTQILGGTKIFGSNPVPAMVIDSSSAAGNLAGYLDILFSIAQWGSTAAALTVKVSADLNLKA